MTYAVEDHGFWNPYVPDEMPEWASDIPGVKVSFTRREGDGIDWYEYRKTEDLIAPGALVAFTWKSPTTGEEIVGGIFRDLSEGPVPFGMRLIEIGGVDPEDPKPWKLFEQKIYDPETKTFREQPPQPITSVSNAQAKTALFNADLGEKAEEIVSKHPYKPVRIFYESANSWQKSNPYVRAIALELGLLTIDGDSNEVDNGLDKLFEDASKL